MGEAALMGNPIPPPQIGPDVLVAHREAFLIIPHSTAQVKNFFQITRVTSAVFKKTHLGKDLCKTDLASSPPQSLISIVQVDSEVKNYFQESCFRAGLLVSAPLSVFNNTKVREQSQELK